MTVLTVDNKISTYVAGKQFLLYDKRNLKFFEISSTAYALLRIIGSSIEESVLLDLFNNSSEIGCILKDFKLKKMIHMSEVTHSSPILVHFEITRFCNLKCKHCYNESGKKLKNELSLDEIYLILSDLERTGVSIVVITGGEPFLHKDIFKIVKRISYLNMVPMIVTNGTFFKNEFLNDLISANVKNVQVSLDSSIPETHDAFRGVPNSFFKSEDTIRKLVSAKIFVTISMSVTEFNFLQLEDLIKYAIKLGCKGFRTSVLMPLGRAVENTDLFLNRDQRLILMKSLRDLKEKYSDKIFIQSGNASDIDFDCEEMNRDAKTMCNIDPQGNVSSSSFSLNSLGNLREISFYELWKQKLGGKYCGKTSKQNAREYYQLKGLMN